MLKFIRDRIESKLKNGFNPYNDKLSLVNEETNVKDAIKYGLELKLKVISSTLFF